MGTPGASGHAGQIAVIRGRMPSLSLLGVITVYLPEFLPIPPPTYRSALRVKSKQRNSPEQASPATLWEGTQKPRLSIAAQRSSSPYRRPG